MKPSRGCCKTKSGLAVCLLTLTFFSSAPVLAQQANQPAPQTESQGVAPSSPATPAPAAAQTSQSTEQSSRAEEALKTDKFTYIPKGMIDPFVSFITPAAVPAPQMAAAEGEEDAPPPEPEKPLTPLQKMSIGELENGLKAITWGDLGRRAVIEDSAGKGFIVTVGTPAGDRNGMVTEIFNDRMVIQQETWDRKAKRMIPINTIVKLKKEQEKK